MSGTGRPLVTVRHLTKDYARRSLLTGDRTMLRALTSVELEIRRGDTLAIVGESGAGKSTLARCLALVEKPTSGDIVYHGDGVERDLLRLKGAELMAAHREIQMIFQDAAAAMNPRLKAEEIVAEPLVVQGIRSNRERYNRTAAVMEQVGIARGAAAKRPLEFSGGERQRLAIARALVLEPKVLILDEALASLDLTNQEAVLRLLLELQQARGLTYVHVCHDLRMAADIADEVAVMHEGRIVEQRAAAEIFARPEHTYTRELLAAMPPIEAILAERPA